MADKIVIVESNAKANTIARYLGKGYDVKASSGHIRDLPKNPKDRFAVDVENGFEPTYQIMPDSRKVVGQLRKAAQDVEEVFLAPDPDREGEAIAWHLKQVLEVPGERVKRVTFNEITRDAVREAFRHPREIDLDLVDAQQARRILDRIVGYALSPLISGVVVRGLSAGRVQSVALRLVVDREREREAFEPEEYWEIVAHLARADGKTTFEAQLVKLDDEEVSIPSQQRAEELVETLGEQDYVVSDVSETISSSRVYPPFITSTMQRSANSRLGFSTDRTMRVAQGLYEGIKIGDEATGLITYMRTDSTRVAKQALAACREHIRSSCGDAYLPKKPNRFKSPKGAQAAHEAIRPTDVSRRPQDIKDDLSRDQYRLYDLIWRRFVASQMTPARYKVRTAEIAAGPGLFEAKGREMVFDGNLRVLRPNKDTDDQMLPELVAGEALELRELEPSQHFTQPPPRFTEASLVRELERRGIGRPSTYAPTLGTLLRRHYVDRDRRALVPTELGKVVTDLLVKYFPREMDPAFTSHMEEELDEVEEGKRAWRSVLDEFYQGFSKDLERAEKEMELPESERVSDRTCPEHGKKLVVRFSKRNGGKFLGCPEFPECDYTESVSEEDEVRGVETDFRCPKCGSMMLKRKGRGGREYLACSAYPKCRKIMGLDEEGRPVELARRTPTQFSCPRCGGNMYLDDEQGEMACGRCRLRIPLMTVQQAMEETGISEENLPACQECGAPMAVRRSRRGLFLGCTKYPDCDGTATLPSDLLPDPRVTYERCNKCNRPMVLRWGRYGRFLSCSGFPRCRNTWQLPGKPKDCPEEGCSGKLIKKVSEDGETYYGCTRYPECECTKPAPQKKSDD